jgi:hypothetical protein
MRNWWGIAAGNSREMQASLDRVSASSVLGREKIAAYQSELYRAGLRGQNLGLALEAVSTASAVVGEEGASRIKSWAVGIGLAGGSVKRLADDVKARFGKTAAAMLLDLNVQTAKLKENFAALFTGLKIDGLLTAVASIAGMFSQATASGRALKSLMNTVLNPLIAAIDYTAPYVRRFFQGVVIGALLMSIAVLRVRNYLRDTFDAKNWSAGLDLTAVVYAGVAAIFALAAAFGVLGVAVLVLASPFILVAAGIAGFVWQMYQLYQLVTALFELPWSAVGSAMVRGIVAGVKGAWTWLTDTMSDLGTAALDAFKSTLGIESPSRAFAELGRQIPAGVASGVESGSGEAEAAAGGMVDAAAAAPGAGGGRSVTINVGGIHVQAGGGADARSIASEIEGAVVNLFERLSLQLGIPV